MNVQFRTSFAKDLREIKNKDLLARIKDTIEQVEGVQARRRSQGSRNFDTQGSIFAFELANIGSA